MDVTTAVLLLKAAASDILGSFVMLRWMTLSLFIYF
jgi:hypothetical protein